MRKNQYLFLGIFILTCAATLIGVPEIQAQGLQYNLLEKLPGAETGSSDLASYIQNIYEIALILIVLSAVLMLSIGGFMYLTSGGNTSAMGTAKSIIFDSLIGLVIALAAYLVLYVINPDLVKVTVPTLPPYTAPSTAPAVPASGPPTSTPVAILAQSILTNSNITFDATGDCSTASGNSVTARGNIQSVANGYYMDKCMSGCSKSGGPKCFEQSLPEPSSVMLQAIVTVAATYPFRITSIAGGDHAVNSAHYLGQAMDIVPGGSWQAVLNSFISNGATPDQGNRSGSFCESRSGRWIDCSAAEPGDHIHLTFF